MGNGLTLFAAFLCSVCGMAWIALAMEAHWTQLHQYALPVSQERLLKGLGWGALLISLALCLAVDHASMAALVWVMLIAASALLVAITLAWRPQLLRPLVAWLPATSISR